MYPLGLPLGLFAKAVVARLDAVTCFCLCLTSKLHYEFFRTNETRLSELYNSVNFGVPGLQLLQQVICKRREFPPAFIDELFEIFHQALRFSSSVTIHLLCGEALLSGSLELFQKILVKSGVMPLDSPEMIFLAAKSGDSELLRQISKICCLGQKSSVHFCAALAGAASGGHVDILKKLDSALHLQGVKDMFNWGHVVSGGAEL